MDFLFHTILEYNHVMVYYSIHKKDNCYFAEILDNPSGVKEAKEFDLEMVNGEWKCSETLAERQIMILGEEIEAWEEKRTAI